MMLIVLRLSHEQKDDIGSGTGHRRSGGSLGYPSIIQDRKTRRYKDRKTGRQNKRRQEDRNTEDLQDMKTGRQRERKIGKHVNRKTKKKKKKKKTRKKGSLYVSRLHR